MLICLLTTILVLLLIQSIILKIIKRKRLRTSQPFYFRSKYVRTIKKGQTMGLVYEVTCAAPVDADVVERRLTISVNGEVVSTEEYEGSTVSFGEKVFQQGDNVVLNLVDVDDVGNVSEPAIVEFVANDTIPPSVPGLSVALVREE